VICEIPIKRERSKAYFRATQGEIKQKKTKKKEKNSAIRLALFVSLKYLFDLYHL